MPTEKFVNTFCTNKPLIAVVHLQRFDDTKDLVREALCDVEKFRVAGVDAIMFENWRGERVGRHATPEVRESMITVMLEASRKTHIPFGVNVLPCDYEMSLSIAKETRARFVQLDTFVDTLKPNKESDVTLEVDPEAVVACREKQGLEKKVLLMTSVQSKHYVTVPNDKPIETSVKEAIRKGSDAIVVTGKLMGDSTPLKKILRAKEVAGDVPVLIGSGLDMSNVKHLFPSSDGAIVGASLKYKGIIEGPVSQDRSDNLMKAVRHLR